MAGELLWIREKWGEERGPKVNVAQEKENEEWNAQDEADIIRMVNRNQYRYFLIMDKSLIKSSS